ncbi:MAG: HIT family protein [Flavobacteriales bacterium]|nr:HIT family protein [Flavobacteriaceae bacterium]PHX93225.1 MAG: HIT family protein [Flavobacteriales bacterium]
MASLFSRIVNGELPCHRIHEDAYHLAFLDISPLVPGHVLVIPKCEIDRLFDMDAEALSALWKFAKPIAEAIEKSVPCKRIGTAVIGLEVPHAHIHLVPLNTVEDINFSNKKMQPTTAELVTMAALIRSNLLP